MGFAVSIDGRVGSPEEVTLKVTDNGFVFGDSAYETLRTYGGRPFELDRHLVRLRRTIGLLGFDLRTSDDEIKARIDACLSFAGNAESYLRVIVSRGVGDMSYRFERIAAPTMAIYVKPLELYVPPGQPVTFEYLLLAAKARGELALGVQIYEESPENKYGLLLNPKVRNQPFLPKRGDKLVVLAEEDG